MMGRGEKRRPELKFRPYVLALLLVLVGGCANQGSLVGPAPSWTSR